MVMQKISLTVEEELYARYKQLSIKNGLKISTRFNLFIKNEVARMEQIPESIDFYSSIPRLVEDITSIEKRLTTLEKGLDVLMVETKKFNSLVLNHLKMDEKDLL